MLTSEAQVLIVDDDPYKADDLSAMIEAGGGAVVGHITDYDAAVEALSGSGFPNSPNSRNVVLLDGEMRPGMSSDGSNLFLLGRRRGWLHGVSEHAPGVLSVSCSIDSSSEVSHDTGATISELDPEGWSKILSGQLAVPQFAPDGSIERVSLDGSDLSQTLQIALGGQAIRKLAALRFTSPSGQGGVPDVLEIEDPDLTSLSSPLILMQVMNGQGGPRVIRDFAARVEYSATAAFMTESDLIVLRRHQRLNPYAYEYIVAEPYITDCAFDKISQQSISRIPALYWTDRQLNPAIF